MESAFEGRSKLELGGEVICRDIANPRTVHRFVQKWIGRWLELRGLAALAPGTYFHVIFSREGSGHNVGCHLRMQVGNQLWSGANYGTTIAEALKQCLEHLNQLSAIGSPLKGPTLVHSQNSFSAATR